MWKKGLLIADYDEDGKLERNNFSIFKSKFKIQEKKMFEVWQNN